MSSDGKTVETDKDDAEKNAQYNEVELSEITTPPESDDPIEQIMFTQKQLKQVKESLTKVIEAMSDNPSLFSRAAKWYGELPLWTKITTGIVLSGPTLAAGIATHLGILLAVSGVTVVAYTAGSILLDDHHNSTVNIVDKLKTGVLSVLDVLAATIQALDNIRIRLGVEVEKFTVQNEKLTANVSDLSEQVESLTNQAKLFIETEALLREQKTKLEETTKSLETNVAENALQIRANQDQLEKLKEEYEKSRVQLSEKIVELTEVRTAMRLEVEKANKIAQTMKGAADALASTVIEDEKQRGAFKQRLESFLANSEESFNKIAEGIFAAERELVIVKEQLQQSNERYKELLARQELQIQRLEKLDKELPADLRPLFNMEALNTAGFFGCKPIPPEVVHTSMVPVIN